MVAVCHNVAHGNNLSLHGQEGFYTSGYLLECCLEMESSRKISIIKFREDANTFTFNDKN